MPCFLASRLVPLDKGQGQIRPVGIGESIRRLLGKAIMSSTRKSVQRVCGAVQTCIGLPSACEAAARAIQGMWDDGETEVVLLVDARNAFNRLARQRALRTARERCPDISVALQNFYGAHSELHIGDGNMLLSKEGTTQGCPLGMAMYAINPPLSHEGIGRKQGGSTHTATDNAENRSVTPCMKTLRPSPQHT
jgi:hypothetical protein